MAFGAGSVVTKLGFGVIAGRILNTPTKNSPRHIGMGTGATSADRTAADTDTALSNEVETRTQGVESQVTTTETDDSYKVVGSITTTAARAVDEVGLFTASSGGEMAFSATHAVVNLDISDSLNYNITIKIAGP